MIGLSWPLWIDGPDFPRVPFLRGTPELPVWVSWVVLAGIAGSLSLATLGMAWRWMIGMAGSLLAFSILQDQNRLQPWAYQFLVIGLMMACLSRSRSLRLARWYVIGLYAYSGLSKLDASFCRGLGPTFLSAALGRFGIDPGSWSSSNRALACLMMPACEIGLACLLIFRSTRLIGLVGAVAQHFTLIWILGPWNLGHSTIVLVWNLALIIEDVLIFGQSKIPDDGKGDSWLGGPARWIFQVVMILPIFERFGYCDAWPAHALYASHAERSDIFLAEEDLDHDPLSIHRHLAPPGLTPWRRLDLTAWSREVRGTPLYPSNRVGLAIALFLEARSRGSQPVRIVEWGRAGFWNGSRDRQERVGLASIRRGQDRFWLNAFPVSSRHQ